MTRRRALRILAFVVASIAAVGLVWAYFSAQGSGSASGSTGTLTTPAAPSVPATVTGNTVGVSWTGVAPPTGPNVAYWVRRHAGATASDACGTTSAAPLFGGTGPKSCNDTPVATGTYTYTVTAVWRSWSAQSAASGAVAVQNDTTAPVVTLTKVNGNAVTFPYAGSQPVTSVGGTCGNSSGDLTPISVTITGNGAQTATGTCSAGAWSASLTTISANGSASTVTATQSDAAGNVGSSGARSITVLAATSLTARAPASGAVGTAIPASSITASLAGGLSASGTLSFTVFGPQAAAPSTCTSGGTAVGSPVSVAGNGTYNPSTGFTPPSSGTYWWYASYGGDASNAASTSACSNAMVETISAPATSSIATGTNPRGIAFSPNGAFAATANWTANTVSMFAVNPSTGALSALSTVATGTNSFGAAFSPGSDLLAVTNYSSNSVSVFRVNTTTGALAAVAGSPFSTGSGPGEPAFNGSGTLLAVPNQVGGGTISMYTVASTGVLTLAGTFDDAGQNTGMVAFSPSGTHLAAANQGTWNVSMWAVNTTTGTLTAVPGSPFSQGGTAQNPYSVSFTPSGAFLATPNRGSNTVSTYSVNATTGALTTVPGSPFAAGSLPLEAKFNASGTSLAVANQGSNSVSLFSLNASTGALTPTSTASTGAGPMALAFHPSSAFVATANFDASTMSLFSLAGPQTFVVRASTSLTATGPASAVAGSAIPASSITAALAGGVSPSGTVSFTVFGPQANAPSTCASGGTAVGSPVTVAGNGTYHPSAGFTPPSSGTYWWHASYGGDANNLAAASTCGASMAKTTVGSAYAWGSNGNGRLGDGTTTQRDSPVPVGLPAGVTATAVSAGNSHSLALTSTGAVYVWGFNGSGQVGDGTTAQRLSPVLVGLPAGVTATAVSAGGSHSLALTSTGAVYVWGFNGSGQVGDGTTAQRISPVLVGLPVGVTATAVSAGSNHSLALTSTGAVYAWGFNGNGRLGDGTTTQRDSPVPVGLPAGVTATAVSAGLSHSLAPTSTGAVYAWGFNGNGQLGDGTTAQRTDPVLVGLPVGVTATAVSAGGSHSLALTSTGAVVRVGVQRLRPGW